MTERPLGESRATPVSPDGRPLGVADLRFHPMIVAAVAGLGERSSCWNLETGLGADSLWIIVRYLPSRMPDQGWKLHIAAAVRTDEEVLRRALPVLLGNGAAFKVVASRRRLAELNEGRSGVSQIGKFITVYPNDDRHAVHLAGALDAATHGLRAPAIPSDRPLRRSSLVHYRYGGFGGRYLQTQMGEILPAIVTAEGTLIPDRRLAVYTEPSWLEDPFIAAGIAEEQVVPAFHIDERYVILARLHQSPRSIVDLCFDLRVPKRCVLKRVIDDGNGSFDRLRREANNLARVAPNPRFPEPFDLFENGGQLFLAMEDIEGRTIEQTIWSLREQSALPAREELVKWGGDLATMLGAIYAKGLVYGDLKASNVLVAPGGHLRLLDFELAQERNRGPNDTSNLGRGTRGYMSPRQAAGHAFEIADDVYGLGAFMYLIATGADPSQAPDPSALLDRPVGLMNPAIGSALANVIGRCLDPMPERRFSSPAEVAMGLAEASGAESVSAPSFGCELYDDTEPVARQQARELARQSGNTICAALKCTVGRFVGRQTSEHSEEFTDLNAWGGTIIALAELVAEFNDVTQRAVLTSGARWLAEVPRLLGDPLPGLYVGEAGLGAAELRAGQVLSDYSLIANAEKRANWIATLPHSSPDLFNGTAGRLRFHLWMWEAIGDASQLWHAVAAGERLLAEAKTKDGEARWTIPTGHGSLSDKAWLGYAHGAAGIGDALLDLFEVTSDKRFLEVAQAAGNWLRKQARPALADGSGLNWPSSEGGSSAMAFWCHGAAGVGRFMLHLGRLGAMGAAWEITERAARTVARGTRWSGATQCHGLAGNIEFLIDIYQATGERAYLREARSLAKLLNAFARNVDGILYWVTDTEMANPGFTAGYGGIAPCLLRLANPETLPHALSVNKRPRVTPSPQIGSIA